VYPRHPLNASGTGGFWFYRISLLLNKRCERNQAALRSITKTSPPHSVLVQFWRLKRLNLSPAPDEGVQRTHFAPAGVGSTELANRPTNQPTDQPTDRPTDPLTNRPTNQPTDQPTNRQTNQPTDQATNQPTSKPTNRPTD
jgi:hypothetical protein